MYIHSMMRKIIKIKKCYIGKLRNIPNISDKLRWKELDQWMKLKWNIGPSTTEKTIANSVRAVDEWFTK